MPLFTPSPQILLQATTGPGGYALINGTGNIITWTAPNDGLLHRFMLISTLYVSSAATGGSITVAYTLPGAGSQTHTFYAASQASTPIGPALSGLLPAIAAGTAVTLTQNAALTGGAATLYAEIWGS